MKKLSLILAALALFASCSAGLIDAPAAAGATADRLLSVPVSLIKATSIQRAHYGMTEVGRDFVIRVQNLSSTKSVAVHHKMADGTWVDFPATYQGPADAGYEIWTAQASWNVTLTTPQFAEDFALFMTANGQSYWDNNGSANYKLTAAGGDLLGPSVNVLQFSAFGYKANYSTNTAVFYGTVLVRNLAYSKKVNIVYTTDSWATKKTVPAVYTSAYYPSYSSPIASPNAYGVEHWDFNIDTGLSVATFEYAISYEVNGVTYWDNNYGKNYKLSVLQ